MKLVSTTLLLFVYSLELFSQTYFNKRYDFYGVFDGATNILEIDNGYIAIGSAGNISLNLQLAPLVIDNQGLEKKNGVWFFRI